MSEKYFVVSASCGESHVEEFTKAELIKRLMPVDGEDYNYYGEPDYLNKIEKNDLAYWSENSLLIIKGEAIVPKFKTVVCDI